MGIIKDKLTGFWPWKKQKTTEQRAEEIMAIAVKYLPQLKSMMRSGNQFEGQITDGKHIGQMYDFFVSFTGDNPIGISESDFNENNLGLNGLEDPKFPKDNRIEKKPLEVVLELETVPTPFTLEGLDEKISLFSDKSKISNQRYAKDQIDGFKKRLENRKNYKENIEFYTSFPNTTDDKIDKLLEKYKLVMKSSELFVPTFPKEAIHVMKKYLDVTEKITGEKPVFYVIAEEKDFTKKREKLDPILLAQSPFGFYWQILGAWDAEMLLLSEL